MTRKTSPSLPSRDILQRESYPFGTIFDASRAGYRVALVYANTYHVGMSNLGFLQIYRLLNAMEGVVCERAFIPPSPAKGVRTLETDSPLGHFDLVAFSCPYETDYPGLLWILEESGIPLRSDHRLENHPLILVGGICPSYNPEPLSRFVDAAVFGEAEEVLPEIMEIPPSMGTAGGGSASFPTWPDLRVSMSPRAMNRFPWKNPNWRPFGHCPVFRKG